MKAKTLAILGVCTTALGAGVYAVGYHSYAYTVQSEDASAPHRTEQVGVYDVYEEEYGDLDDRMENEYDHFDHPQSVSSWTALQTCTEVRIHASSADIELYPGETLQADWQQENDRHSLKGVTDEKDGVFSIEIQGGYEVSESVKTEPASLLLVTVPETVQKITIECMNGEIELEGLSLDTLTVSTETGDVDLNGCAISNLSVDISQGDLELDGCRIEKALKADLQNGSASLDLNQDLSKASIRLQADAGSVYLEEEDDALDFESEGQSGHSYTRKGTEKPELDVVCKKGDIDLEALKLNLSDSLKKEKTHH